MHRPSFRYLALFYVAYVLAGGLGHGLAIIPGITITFWPPAGVFVATLLLNPGHRWPWWVVAGCCAELTCNAVWFHNPIPFALVYYTANALEALTAAWLIRRFAAKPFRFKSLEEVLAFVALGAGVAPMVGATVIAVTDAMLGKHPFTTTWPLVWLGDGTGLLISTPLTLVAAQIWRARAKIPRRRIMEAAVLVAALLGIGVLSFSGYLPTAYMTMPPLLWAAVRFQLQGAATALGLIILTSAMFTVTGEGEFGGNPELLHEKIVMLQIFFGISAVSALMVATLSFQYRQALRNSRVANTELEARVAERTASLRESEERLRLALESAGQSAWTYDPATGRFWSDAVGREMHGFGPDDALETLEHAKSHDHPDDLPVVGASFANALHGDTPFGAEYRVVMPPGHARAGEVRWIATTARLDRPGGRVFGVVRDVTEHKRTEDELRRQKKLTESVVELTPACVAVLRGADLRYELVNPAYQALYPNRVMVGRTVSEVWPEIAERFGGLCRHVLDTGRPYVATDDPYVLGVSGAEHRYFSWSMHRAELPSNGWGLLVTGWETTSRVRAEQDLRNADRRKNEFLATLAHELRNPLAPVRNAVQILQLKGPAAPELQWATEVIDRQMRVMARLIDDLMDVSRINRGKIELKRGRVELATVVQGAVETSRPLIEAMNHELTVTLPPGPVILDADLTRLTQVFLNLLNNAAKYTERGGRIELRAELKGSAVVVSIKDTGIGIPADKLPTLFEMFSQVEGALSRSQGGLGIGLSLVKRLVEMHGGSVTAHSAGQGKGSEFTVRLPMVVEQPATGDGRENADPARPIAVLRILVVDDNRDAAESLALFLKMKGHHVDTADDGEKAVVAAGQYRPQVMLCDIGLPKLNGYEVCRRIRQEPWGKKMVCVAVTGWGQDEDKQNSRQAGFDHHLVKPVDPQTVMKLLDALDIVQLSPPNVCKPTGRADNVECG